MQQEPISLPERRHKRQKQAAEAEAGQYYGWCEICDEPRGLDQLVEQDDHLMRCKQCGQPVDYADFPI